jgi:hypothetical protein
MDNIKTDLAEMEWDTVDGIGLAQDRYNECSGSIKCWETIEWLHNCWPLKWRPSL